MKLLPLVFRNALRNKRRTLLTIGSLVAALFIFVFLRTIIRNWLDASEIPESARRLIVRHKVSLANILPEKYVDVIRKKVPGVEVVHPYHWVGGVIANAPPGTFFQQFACDTDTFFDTWSEIKVPDAVKKEYLADRRAALVGKKTLQRFGWQVGQSFTLIGTIYTTDLALKIVGTYEGYSDDDTVFLHRSYLMESLGKPGIVGTIYLRVKDSTLMPGVIAAVDKEFANSDAPTRTETEKDFIQGFVSMLGNVKGFFMSLSAAVLGAMLLIMVNTMAMAVRERTREIAIMKAIGFTPGMVVYLVVSESILTCLMGGVIGCVGSRILFDNVLHRPNIGTFFPNFCPSWETVGMGMGLAGAMGVVAGLLPAIRAARLEVVAGLRRVG